MSQSEPSFNLWTVPWITLEHKNGTLGEASIEETLLHASDFRAIYDPSPLVVVGIHRLLVAILQDALDPKRPPDLARLGQARQFPEEVLRAFGERFAHRFDIFSESEPFLQSADLPLRPTRRAPGVKSVAYLMPDIPAGTEITHYRHGTADENAFCPTCAARGLVTIPAFATSGGAGIKPSINGVPPIYVLPGGNTLFQSLMASLTLPDYQPAAASRAEDSAWWKRTPLVEKKAMVHEVGYLHSLTFPARRVRLHPEPMDDACTRCGQKSRWKVHTMVFQMGESRPKDAPFWFDPFAAYRLRGDKGPAPIRPFSGKVLWREYAALFLPSTPEPNQGTLPPSVLYQLAEEGLWARIAVYPFRCIGMRTDMKAKVFEWIDADFDVPLSLVDDPGGSAQVHQGIGFATDCGTIIASVFRKTFVREGSRIQHHVALRGRMLDSYWAALATPFRSFVMDCAHPEERETAWQQWVGCAVEQAGDVFRTYSEMAGNDAVALRQRVNGRKLCDIRLSKRRKEALSG